MNTNPCGKRSSALWGKDGGRRTRRIALTLALCAGLAFAAAPTASAKPKHGTGSVALASWAD